MIRLSVRGFGTDEAKRGQAAAKGRGGNMNFFYRSVCAPKRISARVSRQPVDSTLKKTCIAGLNCSDVGLEWWKTLKHHTRERAAVLFYENCGVKCMLTPNRM